MPSIATPAKVESNLVPSNAYISLDTFLSNYTNREDGLKYEWNDGIVEVTDSMNQQHTAIFILLSRLFVQTQAFKDGGGLMMETDMFTSENQMRKPNIAFFSGKQVEKMKIGENQIALWVAEIISKTDKFNKADSKVEEYFNAGVQLVWQIVPASQKVYIFTSPEEVRVCRGTTICSAAPVLNDFEIEAKKLFA